MRAFARNLLHKHHHRHDHDHDHDHDHHHHPQHQQQQHDEGRGQPQSRMVFAHYMVGLTDGQTVEEWAHEMTLAHEACIDGFALNIGPSDAYTLTQTRAAFAAATTLSEQAGREFVLFLSFDMACGAWSVEHVAGLINECRDSPVQYRVDGLPFVSTFEGPGWAENWQDVRRETGGIYLVPDWSSLGPEGVGRRLRDIDGAFSWAAWPRAGESRITTVEDRLYKKALRDKAYMMGVSPWFYTRLPQWDKNWHCSGESLWYDRWAQILEVKPDFVQIITWNDFGESSYICDPTRPSQVVPGASDYVDAYSHAAFRATLPYFIRAYKAGVDARTLVPEEDCAIAWYRTSPAGAASDGDTVWGQGGCQPASAGVKDSVSVLAITREPTTVTVSIGDSYHELRTHHKHGHVHFFEVPFQGSAGPVTLSMHGRSSTGPPVQDECPSCGYTVFNCAAIQV